MNSFNVYGQTSETIGGNTPVWLGTVKPVPVGATISVADNELIPAGTPCIYDTTSKRVTPVKVFGSGMEGSINAYIYNDVFKEKGVIAVDESAYATCAVVMYHPEGLLIERVLPEITEEQIATLQEKVPGVLLVRG